MTDVAASRSGPDAGTIGRRCCAAAILAHRGLLIGAGLLALIVLVALLAPADRAA